MGDSVTLRYVKLSSVRARENRRDNFGRRGAAVPDVDKSPSELIGSPAAGRRLVWHGA